MPLILIDRILVIISQLYRYLVSLTNHVFCFSDIEMLLYSHNPNP
jgi:hypothetical protein